MLKQESPNRFSQAGFTMIELLIVVVILGILAAVIGPNLVNRPDQARQTQAKLQIEIFSSALKTYKVDNRSYPTTQQGLAALVTAPSGDTTLKNYPSGGYLDKGAVPKDPWGNDYVYLCPGTHGDFDIMCYGKDGVQGGEDFDSDITSWDVD